MSTDNVREKLRNLLPKSASKKTLDALVEFMDLEDREGNENLEAVEIPNARVVVDRVQTFGLDIELDAFGDAARIEFPRGAHAA